MSTKNAWMVLALVLSLFSMPEVFAADQLSPGSSSPAVEIPGNIPQTGDEALTKKDAEVMRGKLLKIEDRLYTVETSPGKQVSLRSGKATKFEGDYKGMEGDWIEALVSPDMQIDTLKKSTPAYTMEGSVLKVDRDFFVVKDSAGKEVRLQVGKDTSVQGTHKVGDQIRAEFTPEGQALSIKPAKRPVGPEGA